MKVIVCCRNPFAGTKFASGATFNAVGLQQTPSQTSSGGEVIRSRDPSESGSGTQIHPSGPSESAGRAEIQPSLPSGAVISSGEKNQPSLLFGVVSGCGENRPSLPSGIGSSSRESGHNASFSGRNVESKVSLPGPSGGVGSSNVESRPNASVSGGNMESRLSLPGPSGIQKRPRLSWPSGVQSRKSLVGGSAPVRFVPPVMSRGKKLVQLAQAVVRSKTALGGNESQSCSSVHEGTDSVFYDEISCGEEENPWPSGSIVETTETTVIVSNGSEVKNYLLSLCIFYFCLFL
jgi:hypothetical protein